MLTRTSRFGVLASMMVVAVAAPKVSAAPANTIVVTSTAELAAALVPANEGARIHVVAGEYVLSAPLTVPNDAILEGEGVMLFDTAGLPIGFASFGKTILRATTTLAGDVLTLGDGSSVGSLAIEDVAGRAAPGNPVAVVSRNVGDFVSAQIETCEIVNPNPPGVSPAGPTGRGVAVTTRNPNFGLDPPPHEGAFLRLDLNRSIVRSPGGGSGLFAVNFASHGEIELHLSGNVIGGGVDSVGGVSRPDAVSGASVIIQSSDNLYRSDNPASAAPGWRVIGGTTAPIPGLVSQVSTSNSLQLLSSDDRVEGFDVAVFAMGTWRQVPLPEPSSSNRVDLNLRGTFLQSRITDLTLVGAASSVVGVSPGDGNVVHANIRHATGSGTRSNVYAHSTGEPGIGNRLEIAGDARAFERTNDDIEPPPPSEFFESEN